MNIYISNLSYSIESSDLTELFEEYGQVTSAKVITDRETGRSRGFAFVEMANDEEGQKAIDELNQAEYDGKVISVAIARPKTEGDRGPRRNFGGGGGGNRGGNGGGGYRGGDRGGDRPAGGGGGYQPRERRSNY
jgi:RNA recognition motif-containing protein